MTHGTLGGRHASSCLVTLRPRVNSGGGATRTDPSIPLVVATIFWNEEVAEVGASAAGLFTNLIPVFVALMGLALPESGGAVGECFWIPGAPTQPILHRLRAAPRKTWRDFQHQARRRVDQKRRHLEEFHRWRAHIRGSHRGSSRLASYRTASTGLRARLKASPSGFGINFELFQGRFTTSERAWLKLSALPFAKNREQPTRRRFHARL